MASSLTNSMFLGVWTTILLSLAATLLAAVSSLESEAEALLESGWWSSYSKDTSQRCKWPGISCNHAGSITKINPSADLIQVGDRFGKFNFSSFPNLVHLDLSHRKLGGNIPPQLGDLSALKYLDLSYCELSGELPPSLGNLTQLEFLDISFNIINGSIPPQLGKLGNLVSLNLSANSLNGSIPSEIGNLRNLVALELYSNAIVGPIPSTLYQLINLSRLYLDNNQIEGSIPQNIENLKNLTLFSITNNRFTGIIPLALCRLTKLEYVYLDENKINGSIPSEIGKLKNLQFLDFSDNNLTGPVPKEIGNLEALTDLYLFENKLSGSIPSSIGNLSKLEYLLLHSNLLEGPIPKEIGSCLSLRGLYLSNNNLDGEIPPQISKFYNLEYLNLSYNRLSGKIPPLSATNLKIFNTSDGCKIYPNPFEGNMDLLPYSCSSLTNQTEVNSRTPYFTKIFLLISMFFTFSILGCLLLWRFKSKNNESGSLTTKNGDLCSIWNYDGKIAYEDIIAATEDFDIRHCIGTGGYGSVYKAQLPCGKIVALKKLKIQFSTRVSRMRLKFCQQFDIEIL